ncbi:MAG: VOC family protein [Acidobacteria bacterium]|nr:VOC family protein [Acidobacteriota bacterium]
MKTRRYVASGSSRTCVLAASLFALAWTTPARAQLAPANDMGVALGHIHVTVKDVEAQKRFWTEMLGGTLVTNGPLTLIQFPGIFIMLRQADAAGPAAGSVFDHFGFVYKDIAAVRARWKAAGIKYDVGEVNPNQGYVYAPETGVRVEVFGDPSLPGPVSMDHIHLYPAEADIPAMQAWYAKVFGLFPGRRQRVARPGVIETDYIHRFNLSFSAGMGKLAGTRGRAIDHLGFDVKNIEEFEKKLASHGLTFDAAPRQIPNTRAKVAFMTDPWGTYIEVTEGLAP